jgi:CheY-like chemotaxis protein
MMPKLSHVSPDPTPRVLIVDDDPLVGRFMTRVLSGCDVVFAQSAAGALGRLSTGRGFSAIVCDLQMPGMDGIRLHAEIERLDPSLGRRMIFVTGWADAPEFADFRRRTRCTWLQKPFDPAALREAVERACAGASGPVD